MNFMELIKPELLILVPFLYGIGYLTSRIPNVKDWLINIIITIIAIGATLGYLFAFIPEGRAIQTAVSAILQGVIIAMATITSESVLERIIANKSAPLPPTSPDKVDKAIDDNDNSITYNDKEIEDIIDELSDTDNK